MQDPHVLASRIVWTANHLHLDPNSDETAWQVRSIQDYAHELVNSVATSMAQASLSDETAVHAALALAPVPRDAIDAVVHDGHFGLLVDMVAGSDVFNLITETMLAICGDSEEYRRLLTQPSPAYFVGNEAVQRR